jgi:hypothetical protein
MEVLMQVAALRKPKLSWSVITFSLIIAAVITLFGVYSSSAPARVGSTAAFDESHVFSLGYVLGTTHVVQDGNKILIRTRLDNLQVKASKSTSITTVIEYQDSDGSWKKFFKLTTRRNLAKKPLLWLRSGTKKGSTLSSGFKWRWRVRATYTTSAFSYTRVLRGTLLPT